MDLLIYLVPIVILATLMGAFAGYVFRDILAQSEIAPLQKELRDLRNRLFNLEAKNLPKDWATSSDWAKKIPLDKAYSYKTPSQTKLEDTEPKPIKATDILRYAVIILFTVSCLGLLIYLGIVNP